jgi:hypothetical protein
MEISIHSEKRNPPNFERDSGLLPCFIPSFLQSVSPLGSLNLHVIPVRLWNSGVKFLLLHHSSILVRDKVYL